MTCLQIKMTHMHWYHYLILALFPWHGVEFVHVIHGLLSLGQSTLLCVLCWVFSRRSSLDAPWCSFFFPAIMISSDTGTLGKTIIWVPIWYEIPLSCILLDGSLVNQSSVWTTLQSGVSVDSNKHHTCFCPLWRPVSDTLLSIQKEKQLPV